MLKVAFIHYHLKTGGVTTVLQQQVKAVAARGEALVLTGEPPASSEGIPTRVIPGLGYDRPGIGHDPPEKTADAVIRAIHDRWPAGCDLLHVHNPTLAKNKNFLNILKAIQRKNIRLFLQIHDFAEDGRQRVCPPAASYPKDCHYGVINSRDYNLLLNAGLTERGLHRIFNAVTPFAGPLSCPAQNHVLYPVRAIRRKNIGEALLLSLFFKNGETLKITLPPNSPPDWKCYEHWKKVATDHGLDVEFEAGLHHDFTDLVQKARFLITTSITEGFGFSYLEPWTAGKLLWGRRLPDVCRDFENAGISLAHLYASICIPIGWIDWPRFARHWKACIRRACRRLACPSGKREIESALAAMLAEGLIDFGQLDETIQEQVIIRLVKNPSARQQLIRKNPFLNSPGTVAAEQDLIRSNRQAVFRTFSEKRYSDNLFRIYENITRQPVVQAIDRRRLSASFLKPDQFSLIKWGTYDRS